MFINCEKNLANTSKFILKATSNLYIFNQPDSALPDSSMPSMGYGSAYLSRSYIPNFVTGDVIY